MIPIDTRKRRQFYRCENARKINNKIKKLKECNMIEEGMISDTYHTFDSLYYQRCILFAVICNQKNTKTEQCLKIILLLE